MSTDAEATVQNRMNQFFDQGTTGSSLDHQSLVVTPKSSPPSIPSGASGPVQLNHRSDMMYAPNTTTKQVIVHVHETPTTGSPSNLRTSGTETKVLYGVPVPPPSNPVTERKRTGFLGAAIGGGCRELGAFKRPFKGFLKVLKGLLKGF